MPSNSDSGTQTATVTTEHTLSTISSAGNYYLKVDMKNMDIGDELILRLKDKVLTGSTSALMFKGTYSHVQDEIVAASIPFSTVFETIATLEQTTGTGRSFEWAIVDMS